MGATKRATLFLLEEARATIIAGVLMQQEKERPPDRSLMESAYKRLHNLHMIATAILQDTALDQELQVELFNNLCAIITECEESGTMSWDCIYKHDGTITLKDGQGNDVLPAEILKQYTTNDTIAIPGNWPEL